MFEVSVIASGSSGNALIVSHGGRHFLVDAGISARKLTERLASKNIAPDQLDGVLLTHEHSDHSRGVRVLCGKYDIPVFCNRLTADILNRDATWEKVRWKFFHTGSGFEIAGMEVESFSVAHDAAEPVGFLLNDGTSAFCVLTDLGFATQAVIERAKHAKVLLIEANYDDNLLAVDAKRPWPVKQRIMSRHGHLSNSAAAEVVMQCIPEGLEQTVLGHLSKDCNRSALAIEAVRSRLGETGVASHEVVAVEQDAPVFSLTVGSEATREECRVMETGQLFGDFAG